MTTDQSSRIIEITCDLAPGFEPASISVDPGCLVQDIVRRIEGKWTEGHDHTSEGIAWQGESSGAEWTLRECRLVEEGRWWTEAEIEQFSDRESVLWGSSSLTALLLPSDTLPLTSIYHLIPPRIPIIIARVELPTTTSSISLSLRIPVTASTTVLDILETLKSDLGLPTSTSDLIGNRFRGEKSRARSRSHVSSIFSGTGSETSRGQGDDIKWKVLKMPGKSRLQMEQYILSIDDGKADEVLMVEMDEGWLLEKVEPSTQTSTTEIEEEESNTLKASTSGQNVASPKPTGSLSPPASFQGGTSSSNRLSGLFHGWLDANQHPAPPPSPQLSIVSGQGAARTPLNLNDLTGALKGDAKPILASHLRHTHSRPSSISGPLKSPTGITSPILNPMELVQSPTTMSVIDEEEWEGFLDDLNLRGAKRDAMADLPADRKAYLLAQSKTLQTTPPKSVAGVGGVLSPDSTITTPPEPTSPKAASFISLSAGTSLGLTRLLPQLTGTSTDSTRSPNPAKHGWTKRLSLASLGSWTGVSVPSESDLLGLPAEEEDGQITPRAETASLFERDYTPMEKQSTGGLWGWWAGSANKPEEGSPGHFVEGLKDS